MFYLRDCDLFDSYFYYYVINSHFTHFSFSPFSFKHAAVANILWREEGTKFHFFYIIVIILLTWYIVDYKF